MYTLSETIGVYKIGICVRGWRYDVKRVEKVLYDNNFRDFVDIYMFIC